MLINLALIIFIAAVVALIVAAWKIADSLIKSPREIRPEDWAKFGFHPELVRFAATDKVQLSGAFIKGNRPETILLLHGYSHSKTQLLPQAKLLHAQGYNLFLFDFRGSGESGGDYITFGEEEQRDLVGAVDYLRSRNDIDADRLGIFGFSMGGSVALLKGGELPGVRAIVVDSSYAEFTSLIKMSFKEYLGKFPFFPLGNLVLYLIKVRTGAYFANIKPFQNVHKLGSIPLLVIHGTADRTVPFWDALRVQGSATGPAELMVVQGAGHNDTFATGGDRYAKKVVGFFQTHLGE